MDKHCFNRDLADDLREAFIGYQYNLDYPLNNKSKDDMVQHYFRDNLFHRKVDSLVAGVMYIVTKHIENT
jgi:hypothetical protein